MRRSGSGAWRRMGGAALALAAASGAAAAVPDYGGFVIPDGASDRVISAAHFRCMADRGYTEDGSHACVEAELTRLQPRLNTALAGADGGAAATQAEWTEGLTAFCGAQAALESAEMAPLVRDGCRLDEMVRRILWFEGPARRR